jgi:hypothetical protein
MYANNVCDSKTASLIYTDGCPITNSSVNTIKTVIEIFSVSQRLKNVNITSISVAGAPVHVTEGPIANLGVMFDSSLSIVA